MLIRYKPRRFRTARRAAIFGLLVLLAASPAPSQDVARLPEISQSVQKGGFVSAAGRGTALLGKDTGQIEAWVYPLKIVRDLHLRFRIDGQVIAGEEIARDAITRPESTTIVYSQGAFQVRETLFVPVREPGALVTFEIKTERPLEIEVAFTPDFQLAWPAAIGGTAVSWDSARNAFAFAARDHDYAALIGSPTAKETAADESEAASAGERSFSLGVTRRGEDKKTVCIAASLQGAEDAAAIYERLIENADELLTEARSYYGEYLRKTLNIEVPDAEIQRAYDWARIDMAQALVDVPGVGTGLIAGYGSSGEAERPGFDWFFGRDALWSALALDSEDDFAEARTALECLAKYQRGDGKIPHEVPQSAAEIDWFHDYSYGYASADATPLFLIAASDYVDRSGDAAFAREKWDNIRRAYEFLISNLDADGFAKNEGVGHGWVESGPLVPVRTEIYEAALGIEALRAMEHLARASGNDDMAAGLESRFQREERRLNEVFWSTEKKQFAFALGTNGKREDETTVLPSVPMWFGLADAEKADAMIAKLASAEMQTDWGMRMLSSGSREYASDGYHFGSVWPLFTGWTSVGEYRYHQELPAYLNLRANALLALDGSAGHVTEVLAGSYYEPLATSTPQQVWSEAMVINPILRGMFGLDVHAATGEVVFAPHVPGNWSDFTIENLQIGSDTLALHYHRSSGEIVLNIARTGSRECRLEFSPALSPRTNIKSATLNGRKLDYQIEQNDADQHASVRVPVPAGNSELRIRIQDDFELSMESQLPDPGSASEGIRVLSESWNAARDRLDLELEGIAGKTYALDVSGAREMIATEDADLDRSEPGKAKLVVRFPAGPGAYAKREVIVRFASARQRKSRTVR